MYLNDLSTRLARLWVQRKGEMKGRKQVFLFYYRMCLLNKILSRLGGLLRYQTITKVLIVLILLILTNTLVAGINSRQVKSSR